MQKPKNSENFKNFQKISERFQKISENFQKICRNSQKISEIIRKFQKMSRPVPDLSRTCPGPVDLSGAVPELSRSCPGAVLDNVFSESTPFLTLPRENFKTCFFGRRLRRCGMKANNCGDLCGSMETIDWPRRSQRFRP